MNCYLLLEWLISHHIDEKYFHLSTNPSNITNCVGIEPWTTRSKSDTLTGDYLPDNKPMVNTQLKYVTLNTTYAFNRLAIFFARQPPCFLLMVTVFPFWVIIFLYSSRTFTFRFTLDLYKQLLFAAGKDPSTFMVLGWLHISWTCVIHNNISLAWTNLTRARLNCVDGTALASSGSWS